MLKGAKKFVLKITQIVTDRTRCRNRFKKRCLLVPGSKSKLYFSNKILSYLSIENCADRGASSKLYAIYELFTDNFGSYKAILKSDSIKIQFFRFLKKY